MACEKRPYFCGILVLGILALFFHVIGFSTNGWIVMRTQITEEDFFLGFGMQKIDDGGVVPENDMMPTDDMMDNMPDMMERKKRQDDDGHHPHPHPHPHHHGGHPEPPPHHKHPHDRDHDSDSDDHDRDWDKDDGPTDMDWGEKNERSNMFDWMTGIKEELDIEVFDAKTMYGLWYSTVCIGQRRFDDDDSAEKHRHDDDDDDDDDSDEKRMWMEDDDMIMDKRSDSSDSKDGEWKTTNCRCKRMSTKCALQVTGWWYNEYKYMYFGKEKMLSKNNFAYAKLCEHQVENSVALAFLVLGLIAAVGAFRKVDGCKCVGVACIVFMMIAALLAIIPAIRICHYSVRKAGHKSPISVHAPYSVIASGLGAIFALATALVAGCAVAMKHRNRAGWYQFNNAMDQSSESEKKEKPSLVFYPETLPAKPGLYDSVDFGDLKPVEEVKKQVPENFDEEPNQFTL